MNLSFNRHLVMGGLAALLLSAGAGCSISPEAIRKIEGEPGQEGTGIMFTKLPRAIKILVTYEATEEQRKVAEERARAVQAARGTSDDPPARYIAVILRNGTLYFIKSDSVTQKIFFVGFN